MLLDGETVMLEVVALFDQAIVPPEQPLAVSVRLSPLVIVAGLVTEEVILRTGAVVTVTVATELVKLQEPFVTTTL